MLTSGTKEKTLTPDPKSVPTYTIYTGGECQLPNPKSAILR